MADGRRGRAGTRSGVVSALPSRVPLSGHLGIDAEPVLDYAQAGATTFALARGGLFRLASGGNAPLGTWKQVTVAPLPQDGRGFQGARLFSVGDQLTLFLQGGWGYKIIGGR